MLKVAPCSFEAAKWAVEHWHYSKRMPRGKAVKFGVWEDGVFRGAVVFGSGANGVLGDPYGLDQVEVCELVRVALAPDHAHPVTQVVAQALRTLKDSQPGLRLVVSYADPEQGHHGGIYQAGNWLYDGDSKSHEEYVVHGRRFQGKALRQTRATHPRGKVPARNALEWARLVLDSNATEIRSPGKHRYLMPLDASMRRALTKRATKAALRPPAPYDQGAVEASDGDAPGHRPGGAGSIPAHRSTSRSPRGVILTGMARGDS